MTSYNDELQSWPPPHALVLVAARIEGDATAMARIANPAKAGLRADISTWLLILSIKQSIRDIRDALARSECRWAGHGARQIDPRAAVLIHEGTTLALSATLAIGRIRRGFATRVAASESLTKISGELRDLATRLGALEAPVADVKIEEPTPTSTKSPETVGTKGDGEENAWDYPTM